ncbi:MAG: ADOP family duplicated permease [Vicinamibacterales bacterium]
MTPRAPRLALRLAGLRMPREEREFQLGDLEEEFATRAARDGARAARRWLWTQAVRCVWRPAPGARDAAGRPEPTGGSMQGLWRDVAFGARLIRRAPLAAATAVLTLALGIGANVAIFSVAWPVLVAPLPFPDEQSLTVVQLRVETVTPPRANPVSASDYLDLLRAPGFSRLAAFNMFPGEAVLADEGEPRQVSIGAVTEGFFGVLGVPPLVGRTFGPDDFVEAPDVVLLNERLWRTAFGGAADIVGRRIDLDGGRWTVVGVMPATATIGTLDVDAWTPYWIDVARASATRVQSYGLVMIGRLSPGTTIEQANAGLRALMADVAARYPRTNAGLSAGAVGFRERLTGPVRPVVLLLVGGAVLVLVIAGLNLTALQVARHLSRGQEFTVRRALGASRAAIVRQLTVELIVLAGFGGAAGLGAASVTLGLLARFAPTVAWYHITPGLTWPLVLFTLALTAVAGLLIGLLPSIAALRGTGGAPSATRASTPTRAAARLRTLSVSLQVAMAVLLLVAATLTAASLARVLRVDLGFELDRGLIADIRLPYTDRYASTPSRVGFYRQLVERAEALPGVERACATSGVPLDNNGNWMTWVPEGATDASRQAALPLGVSEGCFDALRIPIIEGRAFTSSEPAPVVILSESLAHDLWPDVANPVGRRVHIGVADGPLAEVVGLAGDVRSSSLESGTSRQAYLPVSNGWPAASRIVVRTTGDPADLAGALRRLLRDEDPGLALANLRTMGDIVASASASRRFVMALFAGFAAIALVLSAVGIYGVLAHQVGQRTREIGIRLALGARPRAVLGLVIGRMLVGVAAGVVLGLAGARALSAAIAAQLYGMSATDARVYAGVAALVLAVAVIAAWLPARRAAAVDPVTTLRGA